MSHECATTHLSPNDFERHRTRTCGCRTRIALEIITAFMVCVFAPAAGAAGVKLGTDVDVYFADVETGRKILTQRDEFIAALSPFDRAARMKTDQEIPEKEFLGYLSGNVRSWTFEETNNLTKVLQSVAEKLAPWKLPFPPVILIVKTSGREEGNAEYTRQNAIILPEKEAKTSADRLQRMILHELFHVLSRHNPELRRQLYRVIGFRSINEIELPEEFRSRKITNPDGVQNGWSIIVTNHSQALSVVPMLYASPAKYELKKGGEFFEYLQFKLLAVENDGGHWAPKRVGGSPELIDLTEAGGFLDQVGNNTGYIIHPDEILADNFVKLMNGDTKVPTPQIIEGMKKALSRN